MTSDANTSAPSTFPRRFRAAEERGRRLGKPLKRFGRVGAVDEDLMERIGRGLTEHDEVGARLADAMRTRAPGGVTMAQFHTALNAGLAAVEHPPAALVEFFDTVTPAPTWVDWDLIDHGAAAMNRLGQNAADVLLQLSLIGGYRFGGPPDLLAATGGLSGDTTRRRLAETQKWTISVAGPDALRPPSDGRPGGEGWRLTVHVRAMHALVNASFEARWDTERWGLPINQADQGSTLGLFDGVLLIGSRALGARIPAADARAIMHLWKYVGHLMGVDDLYLVDHESARHRLNYHALLAQDDITEAGPKLTHAIVDAQRQRRYPGWPGFAQPLRARFETERLLSMLTVFLGRESMRELELPLRPPWAHAYLAVLNTWRYRVLARSAWGRRRLDAWGRRVSRRVQDSYFIGETESVGDLPSSGA